MKIASLLNRLIVVAISTSIAHAAGAVEVTGAGSTFVYPVLAKWAQDYTKVSSDHINYQSIGSGAGITQIKASTVTFGASDKPLSSKELADAGLAQFPLVIGGVVPIVNIEGVTAGALKLTGSALADIYLGKIKKWNDPALVKINPTLKLPNEEIAVVYRSDASGTTFNWTNYLSKVSPDWKAKVGEGISISWPLGNGGKEGWPGFAQNLLKTELTCCFALKFDPL